MPKTLALALPSRKDLTILRKNVNMSLDLDSKRFFNNLNTVLSDESISKNWHNLDVSNIQTFSSSRLFKLFAANDSSFSASLITHVRMLEDNYRITAFKTNKSNFTEGQNYLDLLREKLDFTDDYQGFALSNTVRDQINRMVRNILTSDNAAAALFIKLTDDYEVDDFNILNCDLVYFDYQTYLSKEKLPYIYQNGKKTFLDYANFLWQPLDSDAGQLIGNNPLRPGLRATFTKMEFLENLRKVLKNQAWPKIKVVLDESAVLATAPADVKSDVKKLIEYTNNYILKVKDQLTSIDPDQNIIVYDTIKEIGFLETKKNIDPTPIASLLDSELISSFKTPPSAVGKGGSTRTAEGLASAELVIFRRCIKSLRSLVETIYSRAFTVALRLRGLQGYAEFKLEEFSLRPPEESAQYDSIRQENLIESYIMGSVGEQEFHKKMRHMHGLDGDPPVDAGEREDPRLPKNEERQTERTPVTRESKEKKREKTREKQNTGSGKK